ncbi:hypothetical protein [Actinacidiphila bryophytorum]|uniref:hypothetical protein n=1 Tax=Actinacidiphila bryophytorum TaxID=1436133 RepID=UPI0021769A19|nr:hypothetical protein [Actinacidiphila bryophytorum]UWE10207.1 hypothetical protein NYE86_16800 [Actinacidiphila bryophytorum]
MKQTTGKTPDVQPPKVSGRDTRKAVLERGTRPNVPLRSVFVQAPLGSASRHGRLKEFVRRSDLRALRAFLIVVACCSKENADGWTTTHDSAVWARLLDTGVAATDQAARTAAWRTFKRLQDDHRLVRCTRKPGSKMISVTLLREDGSGEPYTRPDGKTPADRFINIPSTFWTSGYDEQVDVPSLALLLTVAKEKPWCELPADKAPAWYGWSEDTHLRGLQKLLELKLVERRAHFRVAPLSPTGSTMVYQYKLAPRMRPRRKATAAKPAISTSPSGA